MPRLSVVIPAFNEARTIETVIRRVWAMSLPSGLDREVLVVDDGSTDDTAAVLAALSPAVPFRAFHLVARQGKSTAVKVGLAHATGEWVAFQDADLEYDPAHLPRLLAPLLAGEAALVCGSRFRGTLRGMTPLNRLANRSSTWVVNQLYGARLTDVNTGAKVIRRELLAPLQLTAEHFGVDAEIVAKLLRQGHRILEVPIDYTARTRREGKKMNWTGALAMCWCFLRYRWGGV